jgi:amino acid transporter
MGDSRYLQEHGPSYELRERGPSNDLAPSESQLDSKTHLPLDVASIDLLRRRLKQRHVQMYVPDSASFVSWYSLLTHDRIAASP